MAAPIILNLGKKGNSSEEVYTNYGKVAFNLNKVNPNLYHHNRLIELHHFNIDQISSEPDTILKYNGGPGSIMGIGSTSIKFATDPAGNPIRTMGNNFIFPEGASKIPKLYQAQYDSSRKTLYEETIDANLSDFYNMGDPGKTSYLGGFRRPKSRSIPLDKVNARFIYSSDKEPQEEDPNYRDLIRFKIGIVDVNKNTTNYIHFRAIIDSFGDSYNSDWSSQTYMGRGEKLYKYNSFDRSINISFTVAAQSQAEMFGMYQKLNYLASSVTPQYTDKGYMTGNIAKLTVGNYVKDQHGKIDSISFEIPEESPWVTDGIDFLQTRMNEMPFIIKVQMRYTVIHDFRPELVTNILEKTDKGDTIPRFGDQRYITCKVDKDAVDYKIDLTKEPDEVKVTANSINGGNVIPSLYYSKPKTPPPSPSPDDTSLVPGLNPNNSVLNPLSTQFNRTNTPQTKPKSHRHKKSKKTGWAGT